VPHRINSRAWFRCARLLGETRVESVNDALLVLEEQINNVRWGVGNVLERARCMGYLISTGLGAIEARLPAAHRVRTVPRASLHIVNLENFIAVVVDDLDCDSPRFRLLERAAARRIH